MKNVIKLNGLLAFCLAILFFFASCNASKTTKGGAIGAGSGAVLGGIIGNRTGNTAGGAIIGAAVGGAGSPVGCLRHDCPIILSVIPNYQSRVGRRRQSIVVIRIADEDGS